MSQQELHTVIIPSPLAELAVSKRETCGKYATKTGKGYHVATELQFLSFFCILKSLSPNTSQLSEWQEDMDSMMAVTNLSRRAIYGYMHKLKALGLITTDKAVDLDKRKKWTNISLISWEKLAEKYGYSNNKYQEFIPVTYEKFNEKQTPKYILIQAEILTNKRKQAYMVAKKYRKLNTGNYAQEATERKKSKSVKDFTLEAKRVLLNWTSLYCSVPLDQSKSEGEEYHNAENKQLLSKINPSTDRGLFGFCRSYNFKGLYSSIYMKKQIAGRGFGTFTRAKIYSNVMNRAPKYTVTDYTGDIPQLVKCSMKDIFERSSKRSGVWLTDTYQPKKMAVA